MASNVNDDLYGVLGLKKECTSAELRSAYKKLALRWHPDRCSSMGNNSEFVEESKKKFQVIQEAYSVLSDSNKRFLYDVGAYDSEEDQDGMGDFLNEMAAMMNQSKPEENEGQSFEQLQDLFHEMFKGDSSSEFSTTCFPCSTSTYTESCSFIFDNTNDHQWSSAQTTSSAGININMNSTFGFDPRAYSFSLGVEHQQDFKKGKSGGGSSSSNVGGRRNRRKHKVSSGVHEASSTNNYGVPTS